MDVNHQLKPYYKRIHFIHGLRVAFMTIVAILFGMFMLGLWSRLTLVVGIGKIMIGYDLLACVVGLLVAYFTRPSKAKMVAEIDGLGFENRVATYMEYRDGNNPFKAFLEKDLSETLSHQKRYKDIVFKPPRTWLATLMVLMTALVAIGFWQPEPWLDGRAIDKAIEGVEEEEADLLEAIEDLPLIEETQLAQSEIEDRLEAIKEAMAEENHQLVEEELYKMEEAINEGLEGLESLEMEEAALDSLQAEISDALDQMRDLALADGPATLLSSLTQQTASQGAQMGNETQEAGENDNNQMGQDTANSNTNGSSNGDGT